MSSNFQALTLPVSSRWDPYFKENSLAVLILLSGAGGGSSDYGSLDLEIMCVCGMVEPRDSRHRLAKYSYLNIV